jgi:hypothetical protein
VAKGVRRGQKPSKELYRERARSLRRTFRDPNTGEPNRSPLRRYRSWDTASALFPGIEHAHLSRALAGQEDPAFQPHLETHEQQPRLRGSEREPGANATRAVRNCACSEEVCVELISEPVRQLEPSPAPDLGKRGGWMPVLRPQPLDQRRRLGPALWKLVAVPLAQSGAQGIDLPHGGLVTPPETPIRLHVRDPSPGA